MFFGNLTAFLGVITLVNQLTKVMKRKTEEKNQTPMRCPMCGASAVESCKKPEKKETRECPRVQ
jgi:hypothetical protein